MEILFLLASLAVINGMLLVEVDPPQETVEKSKDSPHFIQKAESLKRSESVFADIVDIGSGEASKFQFIFECDPSVSLQKCSFFKTGFQNVGQRISQVLRINTPIIVNAKFIPFCASRGNGRCAQVNNTLGTASSAAFFPAYDSSRSPKETYNYCQALVKQLKVSTPVTFAPVDIYAEFNSDFNFYFKSSGLAIGKTEIDFEFVISHELTHGLGFDTSWVNYDVHFPTYATGSDYLAPLPYARGTTFQSSTVTSISHLAIFDRNVFSSNTSNSMAKYGSAIIESPVEGKSLSQFIDSLSSNSTLSLNARAAKRSATQSNLQFITDDNTINVSLHSPSNFLGGTSIVHVAENLGSGQDFLMIPFVKPFYGQTLEEILISRKNEYIYGPGTRRIMSTIGWPTVDDPQIRSLTLVNLPNSDEGLNSSIFDRRMFLLMAFVLV